MAERLPNEEIPRVSGQGKEEIPDRVRLEKIRHIKGGRERFPA